jgi:phage repressor protein C with HTH and peptisase S24 domain
VNIISDNRQRYDPQDLPEDKVQLVGRVIALVARRVP